MNRRPAPPQLRGLPSVDRVLQSPGVHVLLDQYAREPILRMVRQVLQEIREEISHDKAVPPPEAVADRVVNRIRSEWVSGPRPVINATGVVLHTNLGRAPLSPDALRAMAELGAYSDLEYEVRSGSRGSRQDHVRRLLTALTGAESAYVTVNAASAMTLALRALARRRDIVASRGQAVEIGGGFRIPTILRESGARLIEVGTTNRTRSSDYAEAVSPRTAAFLHVHASNFQMTGFVEEVSLSDLSALAHAHGLLCLDDNGSGCLLDTSDYGLRHEPTPLESLEAGADVVVFSGDKLLGGPQSGIVLGRAELVHTVSTHPLARAVRPDKMTLAGLSATLLSYLRGDAHRTLPLWLMIGQSGDELAHRAERWQMEALRLGVQVELVPGKSTVGGGSLPGETLPTTHIRLPRAISSADLRASDPPIVTRTLNGRVTLDLRTVTEDQESVVLSAVARIDRQKRAVLDSGAR